MKANFKIILWMAVAAVIFTTSCRKTTTISTTENLVSNYDYKVVYDWNELFLLIDKDALGFRPGPAPKALGYIGLAVYETAVPGMPSFNSLKSHWGSELKIPAFDKNQNIHWPTAVNACYNYMFKNFFLNTQFVSGAGHLSNADAHRLIDNLNKKFEDQYSADLSADVFTNSKAWGRDVATAVFEWVKTDKVAFEAELNPLNNDPNKANYYDWRKEMLDANGKPIPGRWNPTNDNPDGGMFPLWGRTRTFATSESEKICRPPLPYSNKVGSPFYVQALEVYSRCNSNISYEDQWVAEFWSDDIFGLTFSPPARLMAIADQILLKEKSNLEKSIEAVAKMGLALNDFGVACWNSKFHYKVERPEHFIKREIDPNWEPILVNPINGARGLTPSFPAYPSGHSTFGGGGAVILTDVFGSSYEFTDNCHNERTEFNGKSRSFNSFAEAGYEDAISRIYLGVHFRMDCEEVVRFGQSIVGRVLRLPWKK